MENPLARGHRAPDLLSAVAGVVRSGNCTGCGLCAALDPRLEMALDAGGQLRPVPSAAGTTAPRPAERRDAERQLRRACPGLTVAVTSPAPQHPDLGPLLGCWSAWATDEEQRHRGSSGGVITALSDFALRTGRGSAVVTAGAGADQPRRSTTLVLTDPRDLLRAAGSRYAPVSSAAALAAAPESSVFVGKPCEVSAASAVADVEGVRTGLRISFFCAGSPSQHATDALVGRLGWDERTPVSSLRYRGEGWPGRFQVSDGTEVRSLSYEESWGEVLGKALPMRCKICPDGFGWNADVSVGDHWETDTAGYPVFSDGRGVSCVIARTPAGHQLVLDALAAGAIGGAELDPGAVLQRQPLQVERLRTLPGRLLGRALAGRPGPRYRGYHLLGRFLRHPVENLRAARGTHRRTRAAARR